MSAGSRQTSDGRPDDSDEQQWVRLAQQRDLAAFNAIVERYQRMTFNLAVRMMGDRGLAEDVTQEVVLLGLPKRGPVPGREPQVVAVHHRRQRRSRPASLPGASPRYVARGVHGRRRTRESRPINQEV